MFDPFLIVSAFASHVFDENSLDNSFDFFGQRHKQLGRVKEKRAIIASVCDARLDDAVDDACVKELFGRSQNQFSLLKNSVVLRFINVNKK